MELEKRLETATVLNSLLKQEDLIKFGNRKLSPELTAEIEDFVKRNLNNLLLSIMGEQTDSAFSNEEMLILKSFIQKIKGATPGATT